MAGSPVLANFGKACVEVAAPVIGRTVEVADPLKSLPAALGKVVERGPVPPHAPNKFAIEAFKKAGFAAGLARSNCHRRRHHLPLLEGIKEALDQPSQIMPAGRP
jgi:hypothetical protein